METAAPPKRTYPRGSAPLPPSVWAGGEVSPDGAIPLSFWLWSDIEDAAR
jgi:hypothetical protein